MEKQLQLLGTASTTSVTNDSTTQQSSEEKLLSSYQEASQTRIEKAPKSWNMEISIAGQGTQTQSSAADARSCNDNNSADDNNATEFYEKGTGKDY